jgi:hypothetical protein
LFILRSFRYISTHTAIKPGTGRRGTGVPFQIEEMIYLFFTASRLPRFPRRWSLPPYSGRGVELTTHSPPLIAKVKNEWSNILTSPYVYMAWCLNTGTTFYYNFTCICRGNAILVQAWTGLYFSRRFRLPEFQDSWHKKEARLLTPRIGRLCSLEIPMVLISVRG